MSLRTPLVIILLLSACSARPDDFGVSATDTSGSGGTTAPASSDGPATDVTTSAPGSASGGVTTGLPPSTSTGAVTMGTDSSDFIMVPDDGSTPECDFWASDCPEGQKCMPYADDGGSAWNNLKCVDVARTPGVAGEPCTVVGSAVSGEDDCAEGHMCWDVDGDTLMGTCVAFCVGSPEEPECSVPGTVCNFNLLFSLCLPSCDPVAADCPNGELCIPNPHNPDQFLCVLHGGEEGQVFDPCEYANVCAPGLYCFDPALAAECDPMAIGCCLPFCDTTQPNTCPGTGQVCLPWYEQGMAPPGGEHIGVCGLPQP